MEKERYKKWAKANQKDFTQRFLEGFRPQNEEKPISVFMAGLPGAGKTEVSKHLSESLGNRYVRIDMDEIAEKIPGYKPENANDFREASTLLINNLMSEIYKRNLSFIMDGTFGSPYAIKNVSRALKHSYLVEIDYIHQDPKRAFDFTIAREKVEKRGIEKNGFILTYFNIYKNLKTILNSKLKNVELNIFIKDNNNEVSTLVTNITNSIFDEITKNSYTVNSLEKYISGNENGTKN